MTEDEFARRVLKDESLAGISVLSSRATEVFDERYRHGGDPITADVEEVDVTPTDSHDHSDEDLNRILRIIADSDRMKDRPDEYWDRIADEIDFFSRSKNIVFLQKCIDLVDKFREEKVVWGVGRGSSAASLVLYVIEIHDIDPIRYGIPFSELSKEM
tara:strand:- start:80087 stop:80560 length:474 start_codon:yes stop_codon:yes gene_type:complete